MTTQALALWPLILMVGTYVGYQLLLKLPGAGINALAFQTIAYFAAFVVAALAWSMNRDLGANRLSGRDLIIAAAFGAVVVGLEYGYIAAYRLGWPVNTTGTIVNVTTALLMVPIGFALFRENLNLTNAAGLALCCVGLFMLTLR
jgi:drug/metabolite transporter (DMT)-like permease